MSSTERVQSISTPRHWKLSVYDFDQHVFVLVFGKEPRTGTIKGMVYLESPDQYGVKTNLEIGWLYHVLIDKDQPYQTTTPIVIEPEKHLIHVSDFR